MVLTKSELLTALQNEVRILLHLASKVDRTKLDYRPTPKQRSTLELLKYLSMMGPTIVRYALAKNPGMEIWTSAADAAEGRDFDQTIRAIAAQSDDYAALLAAVSDADLRAEIDGFGGPKTSRGAFLVSYVLCGCAAYRTQLFLYLKACGQEELNSSNLWEGADPSPAS